MHRGIFRQKIQQLDLGYWFLKKGIKKAIDDWRMEETGMFSVFPTYIDFHHFCQGVAIKNYSNVVMESEREFFVTDGELVQNSDALESYDGIQITLHDQFSITPYENCGNDTGITFADGSMGDFLIEVDLPHGHVSLQLDDMMSLDDPAASHQNKRTIVTVNDRMAYLSRTKFWVEQELWNEEFWSKMFRRMWQPDPFTGRAPTISE